MITADMIPDEVVEAALLTDERLGIREVIAAALNAWPGFEYRADVAFPAFGYGPKGIVLPLPNEVSE